MFTVSTSLSHSKVVIAFRPTRVERKKLLDYPLTNVVNRPASGLVRFSYKLSFLPVVGLVICRPEAAGV